MGKPMLPKLLAPDHGLPSGTHRPDKEERNGLGVRNHLSGAYGDVPRFGGTVGVRRRRPIAVGLHVAEAQGSERAGVVGRAVVDEGAQFLGVGQSPIGEAARGQDFDDIERLLPVERADEVGVAGPHEAGEVISHGIRVITCKPRDWPSYAFLESPIIPGKIACHLTGLRKLNG